MADATLLSCCVSQTVPQTGRFVRSELPLSPQCEQKVRATE